jgi:hypothetical protein
MDEFFEVIVKVKYPIDHNSYQSNTLLGMTDEDQAMFKDDRNELVEVISAATDEDLDISVAVFVEDVNELDDEVVAEEV